MPQLMPLALTVSCFSKIQIGFTFLVPVHLVRPGKGPLNGCVGVCYEITHTCVALFAEWRIAEDVNSKSRGASLGIRSRPCGRLAIANRL